MAADRPGNQDSVLLRQGAQGGQAQEQPAQFATGQRRQLDRDEQPTGAARTRPCPPSSTATVQVSAPRSRFDFGPRHPVGGSLQVGVIRPAIKPVQLKLDHVK